MDCYDRSQKKAITKQYESFADIKSVHIYEAFVPYVDIKEHSGKRYKFYGNDPYSRTPPEEGRNDRLVKFVKDLVEMAPPDFEFEFGHPVLDWVFKLTKWVAIPVGVGLLGLSFHTFALGQVKPTIFFFVMGAKIIILGLLISSNQYPCSKGCREDIDLIDPPLFQQPFQNRNKNLRKKINVPQAD